MNLYSSLCCSGLVTAIYPGLHAYEDPDKLFKSNLPLSWEAIATSGCRLFLLDAQTTVYLYLSAPPEVGDDAAAHAVDFAFPPPRDSAIWKHVDHVKRQQMNTPTVVVGAAGTPEGELFEARLIEDSRDPTNKFSLEQFLHFQVKEVDEYIRASGMSVLG